MSLSQHVRTPGKAATRPLMAGVFLIFFLLLALVGIAGFRELRDDLHIVERQQLSLKLLRVLMPLQRDIAMHHNLCTGYLLGLGSLRESCERSRAEIDQAFAALDLALVGKLGSLPALRALEAEWAEHRDETHAIFDGDAFVERTQLISEIVLLNRELGNLSSVTEDPSPVVQYLKVLAVENLPDLADDLGTLARARVIATLGNRPVRTDREALGPLTERLRHRIGSLEGTLEFLSAARQALDAETDARLRAALTQSSAFLARSMREPSRRGEASADAVDLLDTGMRVIATLYGASESLLARIDSSLRARASENRRELLLMLLTLALLSLLLAFLYRHFSSAWKALELSELRFRQITDNIEEVFWIVSPDSQTMHYISPGFATIWGRPVEALMADPALWLDSIHPEDAPRIAVENEALGHGHPYDTEYRVVRPDGTLRCIHDRGYLVRDSQGEILMLAGVATDITRRKQAEAALRESEQRFRTQFELSSDGLGLVDETGFIEANPALVRLYGAASREALLSRHPAELSPPTQPDGGDSRILAEEHIAQALRSASRRFEWQIRRLDGGELPVEVLLTRIELDGRPVLLGSVRDIGERRAIQAALANAKDQAERASTIKSQFLTTMSHELRTPLNAIMGFTELCLMDKPGPRIESRLRMVMDASHALLDTLGDILDFSRIDAGTLSLTQVPFRLAGVIGALRAQFQQQALAKHLELRVALEELPRQPLLGDPTHLSRVLVNLIGNAIKFSEHGRISLGVSEESREDERILLRFSVSDQGIGIAPDLLPRLFQPFTQLDMSTTRPYGGIGLGLAITRRLVELMGGRIWVESAPGQGAAFHFTAAFGLVAETGEPPPEPRPARALAGLEALVVDDSELNQQVIRGILTKGGMRVRVAANGAECLRALDEARPDCVLMDCQMPVMDGYEATRRLRARPDCRELPVIALTADLVNGNRERCLEAGMNDFLGKPVNVVQLQAALARWLPAGAALPGPSGLSALPGVAPADSAQPPEPSHPSELPELPGLQRAAGLAHMGDEPALYLKSLRLFRDTSGRVFAERFDAARQAGDWPTATRLAHTLKGNARTLGALTLGALAERLEEGVRASDAEAVALDLPPLLAELERVRAGLERLPEEVTAPEPALDAAQRAALLRRLAGLLEMHDTAALDETGHLTAAVAGSGHEPRARELVSLIERFEFAEARERLEHLAEVLKIELAEPVV